MTDLLTLREAVDRFSEAGVTSSERTVRRWIAAGKLQVFKTPGGRLRIPVAGVDAICRPFGASTVAQ